MSMAAVLAPYLQSTLTATNCRMTLLGLRNARHTLPHPRIVEERQSNGKITFLVVEYADWSRLLFTNEEDEGPMFSAP